MLSLRIKIIFIFLICLGLFLITTSYTDADLTAERSVLGNRFVAIVLNFFAQHTATNATVTSLFHTTGIVPGGFELASTRIRKDGQLGFKYRLKTEKISGDDAFCNALQIQTLHRNLSTKYSGPLMGMNINSEITNTTPEDWIFLVSLEDTNSALKGRLCEFNITFKTWNTDPDSVKGIFAQRKLTNIISSGNW